MQTPFVHNFIRIIAPAVFLFASVSNGAEMGTGTRKIKQQNSVKVTAPKSVDFFSKKKMELIKELDEIMREMIWLIRSERPSANKTLFGKVYRALQQAKGIKLTEKNKHSCDQYQVEKVSEFQFRIYEYCQRHRNPDLLAKIDWSQNKVVFQFQGQNYADVLGVAASLVAPVVDCQVMFEDEAKLKEMQCAGLRITRAENVVRFQSVGYKKGNNPMMVLKGEVLKNLLPYSDLVISVPLTGKVQVVEKKKVPDSDETTPEKKAQQKAKDELVNQKPPLVPKPIDPRTPETPAEPVFPTNPVDATKPPRDEERPEVRDENGNDVTNESNQQNPNNILLKNSQPDVIEIQEPPQPVPPPVNTPSR